MNIKQSSGIFFISRGNWDQVKNRILINFPSPDLDGALMALPAESPEKSSAFLKGPCSVGSLMRLVERYLCYPSSQTRLCVKLM